MHDEALKKRIWKNARKASSECVENEVTNESEGELR